MPDNRKITNMTEAEIEKRSSEKIELFLNFKDVIEDYFDSVEQVQDAKNSASYQYMEKTNFSKMPKHHLPIKVYCKSVGWVLLFGIITSYYVLTSQEIQITQSYTKIYLYSLYVLFIILTTSLPFYVFLNSKGELN